MNKQRSELKSQITARIGSKYPVHTRAAARNGLAIYKEWSGISTEYIYYVMIFFK